MPSSFPCDIGGGCAAGQPDTADLWRRLEPGIGGGYAAGVCVWGLHISCACSFITWLSCLYKCRTCRTLHANIYHLGHQTHLPYCAGRAALFHTFVNAPIIAIYAFIIWIRTFNLLYIMFIIMWNERISLMYVHPFIMCVFLSLKQYGRRFRLSKITDVLF